MVDFKTMPSIHTIVGELQSLSNEFINSRRDNALRLFELCAALTELRRASDETATHASWNDVIRQLQMVTEEETRITADFTSTFQRVVNGIMLQAEFFTQLHNSLNQRGESDKASSMLPLFDINKGKTDET